MYRYLLLTAFFWTACGGSLDPEPVDCPIGRIERYTGLKSNAFPRRTVDVWLPALFDPSKRYAVLYMHDGQMLFDRENTWNGQSWNAHRTTQDLINSQDIQEVIIVGIWNDLKNRHSDYFPEKVWQRLPEPFRDSVFRSDHPSGRRLFGTQIRSEAYLDFIVGTVKPFIDSRYPTKADRDHTFIMGSSMGGLISLYALCEYPEVFGGVACLSTHWTGIYTARNNPIPAAIQQYLITNLPPPGEHKFYFDHGNVGLDTLYPPIQIEINKVFFQKGFDDKHFNSLNFPGRDHNESSWGERFAIPMNFLL